uniref:Uncharacterized protein n=1 Tax=Rhizophora mucronata TaxID=61149 RepID=A0A2P2PPP2_RHIMU
MSRKEETRLRVRRILCTKVMLLNFLTVKDSRN